MHELAPFEVDLASTKVRFPSELGLLEAAALLPYQRRSPKSAEMALRRRRGDLTRLAIYQWGNNDPRFGDDLTKVRLHQLVEIAIEQEKQAGIPDFPSVEKQQLDQMVRAQTPCIDSSLKYNLESELYERCDRSGVSAWYNKIDLFEARQAVDPKDKPLERVHPNLVPVLSKQFKKILSDTSVYHFGAGEKDPTYAPGFTFAFRAEDRFVSKAHALTTIALFLATYGPEALKDQDIRGFDYYQGFFVEKADTFEATVRDLILHEDWLTRAESLHALMDKAALAA